MTDTTNPTAKYSKNYSGDVGETPKSMAGTWHLEAPDGRRWAGSCPINCVAQELAERVPVQVQLARMLAIVAEPDLDERHATLGVEYGTGKVDDLVDKLHAEITELCAKLEELEKQEPVAWMDPSGHVLKVTLPDEFIRKGWRPLYLAAGARPVEVVPAVAPIDEYQRGRRAGITEFYDSLYAIDQDRARAALHKIEPQPAPAAQADTKDAARWRYAVEIGGNQRMNWLDVYDDWDGDGSFADAIDAAMAVDKKGQS